LQSKDKEFGMNIPNKGFRFFGKSLPCFHLGREKLFPQFIGPFGIDNLVLLPKSGLTDKKTTTSLSQNHSNG
jgi:hypothetical protein